MSLQELVDHIQGEFADLDRGPADPSGPRAPFPPWLESQDGIEVSPGHEPLFDVESLGHALPADVIVSLHGVDALAYYVPFHFRWRWGIFVREAGIASLAEEIKGASLDYSDGSYHALAWRVLLEHERFHFIVEVAGSRAELVARTRIYKPFFSKREPAELEEALANAYACRSLTGLPPTLRTWMRCQGPGYRDFETYLSGQAFGGGRQALVAAMLDHLHVGYSGSSLGPLAFLSSNASKLGVPVFLVPEGNSFRTRLGRRFPREHGLQVIVHTQDHPPPHIHVKVVQESFETRYTWPGLEPLDHNEPLAAKWRKPLQAYLAKHGSAIGAKIDSVYGRRQAPATTAGRLRK